MEKKRKLGVRETRTLQQGAEVKVEKRNEGEESRTISGYALRFESMSQNLGGFREVILPGALDNADMTDVRALFNHDPSLILARTANQSLDLTIDENGLGYRFEAPPTTAGNDALYNVRSGLVSQSSFAFTINKDNWYEDEEGRVIREISEIDRLYDVSPVTYPAYTETEVTARSLDEFKKGKEESEDDSIWRRNLAKRKLQILKSK